MDVVFNKNTMKKKNYSSSLSLKKHILYGIYLFNQDNFHQQNKFKKLKNFRYFSDTFNNVFKYSCIHTYNTLS